MSDTPPHTTCKTPTGNTCALVAFPKKSQPVARVSYAFSLADFFLAYRCLSYMKNCRDPDYRYSCPKCTLLRSKSPFNLFYFSWTLESAQKFPFFSLGEIINCCPNKHTTAHSNFRRAWTNVHEGVIQTRFIPFCQDSLSRNILRATFQKPGRPLVASGQSGTIQFNPRAETRPRPEWVGLGKTELISSRGPEPDCDEEIALNTNVFSTDYWFDENCSRIDRVRALFCSLCQNKWNK